MRLFDQLLGRRGRSLRAARASAVRRVASLDLELLEDRTLFDASGTLSAGVLTITDQPVPFERVGLSLDQNNNVLILTNFGTATQVFDNAAVNSISFTLQATDLQLQIASDVTQPTDIQGSNGKDLIVAGSGTSNITLGTGANQVIAGTGAATIDASQGTNSINADQSSTATIARGGNNQYYGFNNTSTILDPAPGLDLNYLAGTAPANLSSTLGLQPSPSEALTGSEVQTLLDRASAASSNQSAIIAIVDRSGRILGVRVESGVSTDITGNLEKEVFAIDGAVSEARTGALFSSDAAPITSRTVQFISQSTITQQEVQSDPNDPNPTLQGPGLVAPIEIGDQFPPGINNTPQLDLFDIEATNRDTSYQSAGNGTFVQLPAAFNVDPSNIPSSILSNNQTIAPMDSYGFASGLEPGAQPRGIGTLPGGIPIYKYDSSGTPILVGGIGVFFPGTTGYASAENSALSADYNPKLPDLSEEAEYIAFAALGGAPLLSPNFSIGSLGGVAPLPEIVIPLPPTDQALSALLDDLSESGLLESTLIFMAGEFGRTPRVTTLKQYYALPGRDHWGALQSVFFAGGGVQGGRAVGSSDKIGAFPKTEPQTPENMAATLFHCLGLPRTAAWHDALNRPHHIYSGEPIAGLL